MRIKKDIFLSIFQKKTLELFTFAKKKQTT